MVCNFRGHGLNHDFNHERFFSRSRSRFLPLFVVQNCKFDYPDSLEFIRQKIVILSVFMNLPNFKTAATVLYARAARHTYTITRVSERERE